MELVLSGMDKPSVYPTQEALTKRDRLLETSSAFTKVENDIDLDHVSDAASELAGFVKSVEKARKDIKEPVLKVGKMIDEAAKALVKEPGKEKDRLSRLMGAFQAQERAKVIAAMPKPAPVVNGVPAPTISQEKVLAAIPKAQGVSFRQEPVWELLDINLLYQHAPTLCRIEPNAAAIRQLIADTGIKEIPGLKITWETKAVVAAKRE